MFSKIKDLPTKGNSYDILSQFPFVAGDVLLLDLDETMGMNSITHFLIQRKPIFVSNKQDQTMFPDDLSTLKFLEHLEGGSGGVYKLQDAHGKLWLPCA
jgi:hypothetical protein